MRWTSASHFSRSMMALEVAQSTHPVETRDMRPAAPVPLRGPAAAKKQPAAAPKRAAAGANGSGGPVRRMQAAIATAVNGEPDWKEF